MSNLKDDWDKPPEFFRPVPTEESPVGESAGQLPVAVDRLVTVYRTGEMPDHLIIHAPYVLEEGGKGSGSECRRSGRSFYPRTTAT